VLSRNSEYLSVAAERPLTLMPYNTEPVVSDGVYTENGGLLTGWAASAFRPKTVKPADDSYLQAEAPIVYRQTANPPAPAGGYVQTDDTDDDEPVMEEASKSSLLFWIIVQFLGSLLLIAGGLSGEFVLRGTESSEWLIVFGCFWLVADFYSLYAYFRDKAKLKALFKASTEEIRKNKAYKIDPPFTVSLRRTNNMIGAALGVEVYLNNVRQEVLRNGKTVVMQTRYARNILIVKGSNLKTQSIKFEATPGGSIKIAFKYVKMKFIVEEGQASGNGYQAPRVEPQRTQRPQQPQRPQQFQQLPQQPPPLPQRPQRPPQPDNLLAKLQKVNTNLSVSEMIALFGQPEVKKSAAEIFTPLLGTVPVSEAGKEYWNYSTPHGDFQVAVRYNMVVDVNGVEPLIDKLKIKN
jgi:hypothetical protein